MAITVARLLQVCTQQLIEYRLTFAGCFIRNPFTVNCEWSNYSWKSCSKSCGGGVMHGTRTILQEASNGGHPCIGDYQATRVCNTEPCPGKSQQCQHFSCKKQPYLHFTAPCPDGHSCVEKCPEIEEIKKFQLFVGNALIERYIEVKLFLCVSVFGRL